MMCKKEVDKGAGYKMLSKALLSLAEPNMETVDLEIDRKRTSSIQQDFSMASSVPNIPELNFGFFEKLKKGFVGKKAEFFGSNFWEDGLFFEAVQNYDENKILFEEFLEECAVQDLQEIFKVIVGKMELFKKFLVKLKN